MGIFDFILLSLTVFRLTHLIVFDTILERWRVRFFKVEGEYWIPKGFIGKLISCHWCVGLWVSIVTTILYFTCYDTIKYGIYIFALAAISAILETMIERVKSNDH